MRIGKVKVSYDKEEDILYWLFVGGPSCEVVEADDVLLELDRKGKIMGIEIWKVRRCRLIKQSEEEIAETA